MSNAPLKTHFSDKQAEFAAYIRDPFNNPRPANVSKQRMDMYRELFFNNVDSFLSSNFPVLKRILNDRQWFELAQDFFSRHRCTSPHFSEIPEEFLDYLQNERHQAGDYPFLLELAHYEWVEMALSIAKMSVVPLAPGFIETLADQRIVLSALAWPLAYQFPVQKISPSFLPETAPEQPTYLVVYRDNADKVHFLEINAMTFSLLQLLQENPGILTTALLQQVAQQSGHPQPELMVAGGLEILQSLAAKQVVVDSSPLALNES